MSGLVCITNDMTDIRSCTVKDQHAANCDGWAYRWNETHQRMEATGKECHGCLPRNARHGLLCLSCWEGVVQALSDWPAFEAIIKKIDRAVQRDNGGIRTQSVGWVNLPGTMLAVEEIRSYVRSFYAAGTAEQWVARYPGAMDAVRFARAVAAAQRTHAIEEKAHKIKRTRCTKCGQITLVWNPPEHFGHRVRVLCQNSECGAELDQSAFEKVAAIEKPGMGGTVLVEGGQAVNARGDMAERYDPANPDHQALDPLSAFLVVELREMATELEIPRVNSLRKEQLIDAIRTAQERISEEWNRAAS